MCKVRFLFILFFLLTFSFVFSQQTYFFVDGIQYRTINDYECEVTKRIDGIAYSDSTIIIPMTATYEDIDYNVVSIADSAFYNATTLENFKQFK